MRLSALSRDGMLLENMQVIQASMPELAITAVKQNGLALKYVVSKTPELCLEAVMRNSDAQKYVPEELKYKVSFAAFKQVAEEAGSHYDSKESDGCSLDMEQLETCFKDPRERIRQIEEKVLQRLKEMRGDGPDC
jgi:hypothetical protein